MGKAHWLPNIMTSFDNLYTTGFFAGRCCGSNALPGLAVRLFPIGGERQEFAAFCRDAATEPQNGAVRISSRWLGLARISGRILPGGVAVARSRLIGLLLGNTKRARSFSACLRVLADICAYLRVEAKFSGRSVAEKNGGDTGRPIFAGLAFAKGGLSKEYPRKTA